jgi:Pyruvate/2-oxoacid:ferredoxin oxidoreductase delta subunit
MATLTGLTKGGIAWEPKFVQEINYETCLGCGIAVQNELRTIRAICFFGSR